MRGHAGGHFCRAQFFFLLTCYSVPFMSSQIKLNALIHRNYGPDNHSYTAISNLEGIPSGLSVYKRIYYTSAMPSEAYPGRDEEGSTARLVDHFIVVPLQQPSGIVYCCKIKP